MSSSFPGLCTLAVGSHGLGSLPKKGSNWLGKTSCLQLLSEPSKRMNWLELFLTFLMGTLQS